MPDDPPIVRHVRRFLLAQRRPPGPLVVAVSGGPDSVALLRSLCTVDAGPLVVAHLNHCLRGAESDADEAFVGDLVERLRAATTPELEFRSARRSVTAEAPGENVEGAARRIRHEWFAEVAREFDAAWVATGHTANDQAETVLFHVLRGTGAAGLAGIARRRRIAPGVEVVRPMLRVTRADLLDYLAAIGQDYRTDASNADLSRSRNRIRHDLLPRAIEFNPRAVEVLCGLATLARRWETEQSGRTERLLDTIDRQRAGALLIFDRRAFARLKRPDRRLVWRRVWRQEGWPRGDMGFREWDRLAAICRGGPTAIDLPGRIRVRRLERVIQAGPIGETT